MPVQEAIAASAATSAPASAPASASMNAQPGVAGSKREASDTQLADQPPVKAARFHAEPQTGDLNRHAGVYQQPGLTNKISLQGAESTIERQVAHTLDHTEGAQETQSGQVALSSEQQAARLSLEVKAVPEVPFSVQSDIDNTPIKPVSSVPATSANAPAVAAEVVAAAAAAAASQVVLRSEDPQNAPQAPPAAEPPNAGATTPMKCTHTPTQQLQHRATESIEPPCSPESFNGTYIADLLAKRRQELMAEAGVDGSSPHSSA